jgi:E3 ubiquitin-protein ligase SHPRH
MGLGKTLQTLMLVLSNPAPEGWAVKGPAHPLPTGTYYLALMHRVAFTLNACSPARTTRGGPSCTCQGPIGCYTSQFPHPRCQLKRSDVGQVRCAQCYCPPTDDDPAVPIRTTLLVMPSNLVSQWIDEIEAHVEPGALKW